MANPTAQMLKNFGELVWYHRFPAFQTILPALKHQKFVLFWQFCSFSRFTVAIQATVKAWAQNTTQKSISIAFCVSSIRHDSSLSKYRKQKQPPPWTCAIFSISRGGLLLFTVLAE
jgi:hypothetical protein